MTASPLRAWRVFVQRTDARIDIAALENQAARFFRTKIGLMAPKRYDEAAPPSVDEAEIAIAPPARDTSIRRIVVRPVADEEYVLAAELEHERSVTGLSALARRCNYVVEVERAGGDDAASLLLAAILASTHLGPIMDVDARDLFGVKTARIRLAAAGLSL